MEKLRPVDRSGVQKWMRQIPHEEACVKVSANEAKGDQQKGEEQHARKRVCKRPVAKPALKFERNKREEFADSACACVDVGKR